MKQLVFTYSGYQFTNIGDYIQSLAAMQFVEGSTDIIFWNRDELSKYKGEQVYAIMNGWFTHKSEFWPPSPRIIPLFVATHFNSSVYDVLLSPDSINYLKKHQPIGCRDKATADLLLAKGVEAYFSSCLTTTLGYKYKALPKTVRKGIVVVDPVHFMPELSRKLRRYLILFKYIRYFQGVNKYIRNLLSNNPYDYTWKNNKYNVIAHSTRSYIILRKILGRRALESTTVLTQYHHANDISTDEERFNRARQLLSIYAHSELVLTSRIHCALPCLGLETPVVFLQNMDDSEESRCRFNGLLDLLNVIKFKRNKIIESPYKLPLTPDGVTNKSTYRTYVDALISLCSGFVKSFKL